MDPIKEALTFDDVTLAPKYSEILPSQVDTSTYLRNDFKINIPLLSSAMDTVTESKMAIAIAKAGGIGVIHRNLTIDNQIREIKGDLGYGPSIRYPDGKQQFTSTPTPTDSTSTPTDSTPKFETTWKPTENYDGGGYIPGQFGVGPKYAEYEKMMRHLPKARPRILGTRSLLPTGH